MEEEGGEGRGLKMEIRGWKLKTPFNVSRLFESTHTHTHTELGGLPAGGARQHKQN